MNARAFASLLCLTLAGAANAGNVGAGPAGSAASAVGSIVTPGSNAALDTAAKDDRRRRVTPGNGGHLVLSGDQLNTTAEMLRGFAGAEIVGTVIRAPTVLADGTSAVISLNTRTGVLLVVRQE